MPKSFLFFRRFFSVKNNYIPKISIVGSGPAGFYAAQYLLKKLQNCEIDIFEKLPIPFGLVRFGVAPDHPEVKNVEHTFCKIAEDPRVRFLGNIHVGKNIAVRELREAYNIIILAYGAEENKNLNIKGETLKNVIPARKIVGWYNGIPWDKDISIDLTGEVATIIGQGNVSIDIARILLKPVDDLKTTDITQHSLELLSKSKIKTVYLIGRRGPLQAAFTIKELREMIKLKNCETDWRHKDFKGISDLINDLPRPKKRIAELMLNSITQKGNQKGSYFKPIFFRTPLEFIGNEELTGLKLGINELEGDDIFKQRAVFTNSEEIISSQLGVISIGYKSVSVDPTIPFSNNADVIMNDSGKVNKGLYATGWLATGSTGVILNTMSNSFFIAETILKDLENDSILVETNKPGFTYIKSILEKRNIQIVHWRDWQKIDNYEIEEGKKFGKVREKVVDIKKMLDIAS